MKTKSLVGNQCSCPVERELHRIYYVVNLHIIIQATKIRNMYQGSDMNIQTPLFGELVKSLSQI